MGGYEHLVLTNNVSGGEGGKKKGERKEKKKEKMGITCLCKTGLGEKWGTGAFLIDMCFFVLYS